MAVAVFTETESLCIIIDRVGASAAIADVHSKHSLVRTSPILTLIHALAQTKAVTQACTSFDSLM